MSPVPWPPGVPYVALADSPQEEKPFNDPVTNGFDGGNTRSRPMPGDRVRFLPDRLLMSDDQWSTFYAWLRDDLGLGTALFTAPADGIAPEYAGKTSRFKVTPTKTYYGPGEVVVAVQILSYDY